MFFDIKQYDSAVAYAVGEYVYFNPDVSNWSAVKAYQVGDYVYYNGNTYRVILTTTAGDLPTDVTKFAQTSINRKIYKVIAPASPGSDVSNTSLFIVEDPRDAHLVSLVLDVFMHQAFKRVVNRNVPKQYVTNYDITVQYLKEIADNRKNVLGPWPLREADTDSTDGINDGYDIFWGLINKIDNGNNY